MLNAKQKEAVEYLDGPLLVLAGPGTGKTQLLAHKVAYILENTDTNPENILCLTFTDAGVTAMRERLLSMRVASADRVNIATYHSFGSQILATYKNYAESFKRNLDQPINPVTQYKLIKKIVQSLPATDILRATDPSLVVPDLISTIKEVKSARLTSRDLFRIAERNEQGEKDICLFVEKCFLELKPRMKFEDATSLVYYPLAAGLADFTSKKPIVGNIYSEVNSLLLDLNTILETESAKEKPSVAPLTKWKNDNFERSPNGLYRSKNHIATLKLSSLATVMEKYESELAGLGKFDFADMIEEAIHALETDPGFKATLQERFQYIMLDEFQDTNPSQFDMVHLLSDYESPCIMAVGDDDQAIYAFQGANASNLLDFANTYHAKIITLNENYRSTSEILDFSRRIADQIDDSFAKNRNINKSLTSVRNAEIINAAAIAPAQPPAAPSGCFVSRHEFVSAELEYTWVADQIKTLIDAGEKPSEIAIIVPKHQYIQPILPYLKNRNIDITYEKREDVLADPRIKQLSTLCRFIYDLSENKNPSHLLLEILSFDFWHLDPLEIMQSIQARFKDSRTAFDYLVNSENANPRLQVVANFLAELVQKSYSTPLSEFLQIIATKILEEGNNEQTVLLYENLSVLNENLKTYLETEKPRLKDFVDFLDDYEAASATILNTSPYRDSSDTVQVLTVHKSKGLEYKHVFLISVDSISWGKAKGNNNKFTLPINLRSIRHTGITANEQLRSLFVAATRAKLSLTMTNSQTNFLGKAPSRLEYLQEYSVDDSSVASPLLKNPDVFEHSLDQLSETDKTTIIENSWLSNYFTTSPNITELLRTRLENYRLTASDLTTFIDIIYAGPLEFYKRSVLRAPSDPASISIHLGNLIHATFEKVTTENLSDSNATDFFKQELSKLDLSQADAKDLEDRGLVSLKASLKAFAPILHAEHARAEVNLSHEHLIFNNIPITGKIDHIDINDADQTIEIYDFKTGKYKSTKWESDASLFKYSLQLGFYKLLLNLSPTYSKYKIKRAHILFVSPDADGEVYDKIFDFSPDFEENLKTLLEKVYSHIKSLDFVDPTSPLHVSADSSRSFKAIKDFIQLL